MTENVHYRERYMTREELPYMNIKEYTIVLSHYM